MIKGNHVICIGWIVITASLILRVFIGDNSLTGLFMGVGIGLAVAGMLKRSKERTGPK